MLSGASREVNQRRLVVAGLLFLLVATVSGICVSSVAAQGKSELTVSAAISLKDSLDEIGSIYEKAHPEVKITFNYGGSGTLQRQIEQGAPVDLFFSAAEKQMEQLQQKGLVDAGTRRNIVANRLVLIAPAANQSLHDFEGLTDPRVK